MKATITIPYEFSEPSAVPGNWVPCIRYRLGQKVYFIFNTNAIFKGNISDVTITLDRDVVSSSSLEFKISYGVDYKRLADGVWTTARLNEDSIFTSLDGVIAELDKRL